MQTVAKNFRRYVRPLFIDIDQKSDGPYKQAYDIFGWVVTQITFSYIVAPFLLLDLSASVRVWSNLYFLIHFGVIVSMAFFSSPGKGMLVQQQKKRIGRAAMKSASSENLTGMRNAGPMGLPDDMEGDIDEIKTEFKHRRDSFIQQRRNSKKNVVEKVAKASS